jgi:hypothetical protein
MDADGGMLVVVIGDAATLASATASIMDEEEA